MVAIVKNINDGIDSDKRVIKYIFLIFASFLSHGKSTERKTCEVMIDNLDMESSGSDLFPALHFISFRKRKMHVNFAYNTSMYASGALRSNMLLESLISVTRTCRFEYKEIQENKYLSGFFRNMLYI